MKIIIFLLILFVICIIIPMREYFTNKCPSANIITDYNNKDCTKCKIFSSPCCVLVGGGNQYGQYFYDYDFEPLILSLDENEALTVTTNKYDTVQFLKPSKVNIKEDCKKFLGSCKDWQRINVDSSHIKHKMQGFGTAFTDSSMIVLCNLKEKNPKLYERILKLCYGNTGNRYNLARVNVGSCDFSARYYSHVPWDIKGDDMRKDVSMGGQSASAYKFIDKNFTFDQPEDVLRIEAIKYANNVAEKPIRVFASVWSAPPWMKENRRWVPEKSKTGIQQNVLLPNMLLPWARYFHKFCQAYRDKNLPLWAVTPQNEPYPLNPDQLQTWETMFYSNPKLFVDFYGYLHEQLKRQHVGIIAFDDQKGNIKDELMPILSQIEPLIIGVGFHWYKLPADAPVDVFNSLGQLKDLRNRLSQDKFILGTEACNGYYGSKFAGDPGQSGVDFGNWSRLFSYALDIIKDINSGACGWMDWNLCLDVSGGPNHSLPGPGGLSSNKCDSPILIDVKRGLAVLQPQYFGLAHFSRFFREDKTYAIGIDSSSTGPSGKLEATAMSTEIKGKKYTIIIVINTDYVTDRKYYIKDSARSRGGKFSFIENHIPPHSIQTTIFRS